MADGNIVGAFGDILTGFRADISGRGQAFRSERERRRLESSRALTKERKTALAQDALSFVNAVKAGDLQGADSLLTNRIELIGQLDGDPTDSIEHQQKFRSGDVQGALADGLAVVDVAQQKGFLERPQAQIIPSSQIIDGQFVRRTAAGGAQAEDIVGLRPKKSTLAELEELEKLKLQNEKARLELAKLQGKPSLDIKDKRQIQGDVTSLIKEPSKIRNAASRLAKIGVTKSATDQLAAIFTFMKALDPTSVVREGEQAQARSTGGVTDQLLSFVTRIQGEGSLPKAVFENMIDTAKRISNQAITDSRTEVLGFLDTFGEDLPDRFRTSTLARLPGMFKVKQGQADPTEDVSQLTDEQIKAGLGL